VNVFVSSYAAAPPAAPGNGSAEAAVLNGLARLELAGLELPVFADGRFHAADEARLLPRLLPSWRFVLSALPGTMSHIKDDPRFGLASDDGDGRTRALDFAEAARFAAARLNRALGRRAVAAVSLHSAPRPDGGACASAEALTLSLCELRRRDWEGAELLIEHCDAFIPGQTPDKGFLRLDEELRALARSSGPVPARLLLNWGRSAVETRSATGALAHVRAGRDSGLLAGLFFSGAAPAHADYGAWRDSHAPFSTSCPGSLLTPEAAQAALKEAGLLSYVGLKIQPLPASLDADARLAMIKAGLDALAL
jgi:hypothetical protein